MARHNSANRVVVANPPPGHSGYISRRDANSMFNRGRATWIDSQTLQFEASLLRAIQASSDGRTILTRRRLKHSEVDRRPVLPHIPGNLRESAGAIAWPGWDCGLITESVGK